ncbi:HD domain-containing protein [Clostridium folliculivorans]|uniref:Phosphohydrolase n=1 Tax=Clostridium folliculivorans TaxID=2886038 RepID=A0A9W6DBV2_9CLOT|nr:HD domain-containing protein [Clostridium folliculivorans]GKU26103.1 phosphohydrolase [Clostridium folliculivorans]GKU28189.1 phosphohydrolase [Clostridium folliculivorans]
MTEIIQKTAEMLEKKFSGEGSGHDWWHIYRVWQNAKNIAAFEKCDKDIVELAALLHDIADWKFNDGDEKAGSRAAKQWLEELSVDSDTIVEVCYIIDNVTFKGAKVVGQMDSIEGMIVQDADRLDAVGAIGIGRAFAYGGFKGREMYNPNVRYEMHDSFEGYKNSESNTINHFYEKLLLLKDMMNTERGKVLAEERHKFMQLFLDQFYKEWNGEL